MSKFRFLQTNSYDIIFLEMFIFVDKPFPSRDLVRNITSEFSMSIFKYLSATVTNFDANVPSLNRYEWWQIRYHQQHQQRCAGARQRGGRSAEHYRCACHITLAAIVASKVTKTVSVRHIAPFSGRRIDSTGLLFGFFPLTAKMRCTDYDAKYVKWRGFAQRCAFWGSQNRNSIF